MCDYIEINKFIKTSVADGPGVRTVLFLQGCSMKCIGCHNELAQEKGKGVMYNLYDLIEKIKSICINKKITISGGEPMEQYDSLLKLVYELNKLQFNICLYTGWDLKDIPKEILNYINYLKVGPFINSLKDSRLAFYGSTNQEFLKINGGIVECLKMRES